MKRLASSGEIGEPCGVPFSRATRVPSAICMGALSGSSDPSVGRFIGSGTAKVYWSRLVRDIAAIIQGVKLALCLWQELTTCQACPDDNPQRSGGASVRGFGG